MPWTVNDVSRHNKEANTKRLKKIWVRVANQTLADDPSDEGKAVRIANHAVQQAKKTSKALWITIKSLLS